MFTSPNMETIASTFTEKEEIFLLQPFMGLIHTPLFLPLSVFMGSAISQFQQCFDFLYPVSFFPFMKSSYSNMKLFKHSTSHELDCWIQARVDLCRVCLCVRCSDAILLISWQTTQPTATEKCKQASKEQVVFWPKDLHMEMWLSLLGFVRACEHAHICISHTGEESRTE